MLLSIHKERERDDGAQCDPTCHYVLVDDKLRLVTAVQQVWGARLTTVQSARVRPRGISGTLVTAGGLAFDFIKIVGIGALLVPVLGGDREAARSAERLRHRYEGSTRMVRR